MQNAMIGEPTSSVTVSVVIPTFNYARYVTAAIESVLAQTYTHYEIIVVDDGSTDDTRERLVPYMNRIRYLYQTNQGLSAARNTGIREAKGKWIAFLDSDDLWHPRKLEIQIAYLTEHPDVTLVASDCLMDLDAGWPEVDDESILTAERIRLEDLVIRSRFGSCSVVVRKDCFRDLGYFDSDLRSTEDRDMWIRIAASRLVVKLPLPLWWVRIHRASMSYVPQRMDYYGRKVVQKAFAQQPTLKRNWPLKLMAFSVLARSSALTYEALGMHSKALARILFSFLLWPLPLAARHSHSLSLFERPKILCVILLRILRLMRPDTSVL